jgi:hypothetical protein
LLLWGLAFACGEGSDEPEVALTTISGVRCTDGAVACGDTCAQLASSAEHCGGCGNVCASFAICDRGQCRPAAEGCSAALSLCGSDCVDLTSADEHCGACDNPCAPEADCAAGSCVCPNQLAACGATCVDTQSDRDNCGACGQGCVDAQTCEAGSCVCPSGMDLCSSQGLAVADGTIAAGAASQACVDTQVDARHCGGCGNACGGGQVCVEGGCVCPEGQTLCGDTCVDTDSNLANCGSCGNACGGGEVCVSGDCACPEGQTSCDGTCIDTETDTANCGGCGSACSLGQGCTDGSCESGALGEDGCQGLALNLSISQIAAYQTVKVELARDGASVPASPSLVAGRPTLVRAFVTPGNGWVPRELSARLFLRDGDAVATEYSVSTLSVAAASQEDDRATTFEFLVAPESITANTSFAVEIVECGEGSGTVASPRFPAGDAQDLGAVDTGGLRLHLVPLRSNGRVPDTSEQALALYEAGFLDTYPVASVEITVGEPFDVDDPEDWGGNLDALRALRQQEAPPRDVYYYGMLSPTETLGQFCGGGCVAGVGYVGNPQAGGATRVSMGLAYADVQSAFTMLHEVGHNHGRNHAPCAPGGQIDGVDPNFPQDNGSVGVYGYDALGDQLLPPDFTDLMGYCNNQWLSAYTYGGILNAVLTVNQVQASVISDPERIAAWRVLLVDEARGPRWGRQFTEAAEASGDSEPALVFDAAGALVKEVSVFRTEVGDFNAASIQVPEPEPGWHSIQVTGAPPIVFAHEP